MASKAPKAGNAGKAPAAKAVPAAPAPGADASSAATPVPDAPAALAQAQPAPDAERAAQPAARKAVDAQLRRYLVGSVPIRHDDKVYGVGYDIDLTAAQAERLGHLVTPIPTTRKE